MSPEQAERNQLDIDTRSDIYSLGVCAVRTVDRQTPFDGERLRSAAWDEMLRIIREEEPPKPSTRLEQQRDAPVDRRQSHIEPAKLGIAGPRRVGLDRDEGPGEGPHAGATRRPTGLLDGHPALSER